MFRIPQSHAAAAPRQNDHGNQLATIEDANDSAEPQETLLVDDCASLLSRVARAVYFARLLCPFPMVTTKYATMLPRRRKGAASKIIPTQAFIRSLARISRSAARCHRRVSNRRRFSRETHPFEVTNVNSPAVPAATMRIDR